MTPLLCLAALVVVRPDAVAVQDWGAVDGQCTHLFELRNRSGAEVDVTDYGARVVRVLVPDRGGVLGDVVAGYDEVQAYADPSDPVFGAIVGRFANRIANGRFELGGRTYKLAVNNPPNSLHGGIRGFDRRIWTPKVHGGELDLTYVRKDGEEGYPGTLTTTVSYRFTDRNEMQIGYEARTTAPTVLNLTNHSYFNLSAGKEPNILDHVLTVDADQFTPADPTGIPSGQIAAVAGTPLNFRKPTRIGERIDSGDNLIRRTSGYDHNFVVRGTAGTLRRAARVEDPMSGRTMEVWTTQPGVQFYTSNGLNVTNGKGGARYGRRYALCLETQHYPDSPNKPSFPSTVLRPGERFRERTVYRFGVEKS